MCLIIVHKFVLHREQFLAKPWIPWNLLFRYIQCSSQFTPKMKANAKPRLLSSLVWIDSGVAVSLHHLESFSWNNMWRNDKFHRTHAMRLASVSCIFFPASDAAGRCSDAVVVCNWCQNNSSAYTTVWDQLQLLAINHCCSIYAFCSVFGWVFSSNWVMLQDKDGW